MTDFTRINGPRVEKIKHMIGTIEKSAASQKVSFDERRELLSPIIEHVTLHYVRPEQRRAESAAPSPQPTTPPVAKEVCNLEELSTTQLIDRMIACGEKLARRRT